MKKSKLMSAVLSAVMIGCTVSALPANALAMNISGEENLTAAYKDWNIIEEFDFVDYFKYNDGTNISFYDYSFLRTKYDAQSNTATFTIHCLKRTSDFIEITAPPDVNVLKDAGLKDINSDLWFEMTDIPKNGSCCTYIIGTKNKDKSISLATAMEIYNKLGDSVTSFELSQSNYSVTCFNVSDLLKYRAESEADLESLYDTLSTFAAENNINAQVKYELVLDDSGSFSNSKSNVHIVPNYEMTGLERLSLIKDIYSSTGLVISYTVPEMTDDVAGNITDLKNYVAGDANVDGKVDISDAVLILQFLANPDKYPITAHGMLNADIVGNDGVTALDALQIQMMEAGSIS